MTHNHDVTINKFPDPSKKSHRINLYKSHKLWKTDMINTFNTEKWGSQSISRRSMPSFDCWSPNVPCASAVGARTRTAAPEAGRPCGGVRRRRRWELCRSWAKRLLIGSRIGIFRIEHDESLSFNDYFFCVLNLMKHSEAIWVDERGLYIWREYWGWTDNESPVDWKRRMSSLIKLARMEYHKAIQHFVIHRKSKLLWKGKTFPASFCKQPGAAKARSHRTVSDWRSPSAVPNLNWFQTQLPSRRWVTRDPWR